MVQRFPCWCLDHSRNSIFHKFVPLQLQQLFRETSKTDYPTDIGGKNHLADASTILFCISFVLVAAVYAIYFYGPTLRERSPFAQQLSQSRAEHHGHTDPNLKHSKSNESGSRPIRRMPTNARTNSYARETQNSKVRQALGSRQGSHANTPRGGTPRQGSRNVSRRNSAEMAAAEAPNMLGQRASRVVAEDDEKI